MMGRFVFLIFHRVLDRLRKDVYHTIPSNQNETNANDCNALLETLRRPPLNRLSSVTFFKNSPFVCKYKRVFLLSRQTCFLPSEVDGH